MDTDDHQACTSMDISDGENDELAWRFSQVKGHVEPEEVVSSDGEHYFDRGSEFLQSLVEEGINK